MPDIIDYTHYDTSHHVFLLIIINLDNIDQAEHNGFEEEAENQRTQLKAGIAASVVAGIKIADSMKDGIKDIADVDHWKN